MEDSSSALAVWLEEEQRTHLDNVARNLQFVADLGYGDVALAVRTPQGSLAVVADARPMTAVAAVATSRVGKTLSTHDEPEAYQALQTGQVVAGDRRRTTRGMQYVTSAHPIGIPPFAVVIRDLTQQVVDAPGTMERQFMELAVDLLEVLGSGPLSDVVTRAPFATTRRAGDGVMRIDSAGLVAYASPNAVNILRLAGVEGALTGTVAAQMPGGAEAVAPVLRSQGALQREVAVAGRVLLFRTVALRTGAVVLVEDITDATRRDVELKVKEATIREVHHRVKNNLQTISSLLRIQARRSDSPETQRSLAEAVERVGSMAVVHELLSTSTDETVDFGEAARTVVDMVRQGLAGRSGDVAVEVEGTLGDVPASVATSLALATAELVHNAIEHGLGEQGTGRVTVTMRRLPDELQLSVRDDGKGLPEGFDPAESAQLGLAIVRTIVEGDLRGTLTFLRGHGTTVRISVPVE